jgi:hypothetical protein
MVASALGGFVGGSFVLLGVRLQFRHQSEAALRALAIEVDSNATIALQMTEKTSERNQASGFPLLGPDPGSFRRSVWDSQLPFVVQILDQKTLALRLTVHWIRYRGCVPLGKPFPEWMIGPGVDSILSRIESSFRSAAEALHIL